ncbi:hypothetical protein BD324DRAFT_154298 [Kockovaella imperatae]|uniref:Uncharacterized protein n=1 Tax=Kockovaella imperatae TaxID=4999 RepID=A0A1Y1UBL7_9TREE|nr:hypothetical protein BD324DRAFT_154298 [Kockovaella imperatae]ORX34485.1 hypothetical protein BD324DRAFT_154298 [Kockovaella imperatae]
MCKQVAQNSSLEAALFQFCDSVQSWSSLNMISQEEDRPAFRRLDSFDPLSLSGNMNEPSIEITEEVFPEGNNGSSIARPEPARMPSHLFVSPLPALERAEASTLIGVASIPLTSLQLSKETPICPSTSPMTGVSLSTAPSEHSQYTLDERQEGASSLHISSLGEPATHPRDFLHGRSLLFKCTFVSVTCSAQLIAQGQFGMVMIPLKEIGDYLRVESAGELSWMTASYG